MLNNSNSTYDCVDCNDTILKVGRNKLNIILTSPEMPPTNILFGMRVPYFGMCPDKTGVSD
jgi:hypothetical protein